MEKDMTSFTEIPVIDVSAVLGDDDRAKADLAAKFADVYGRIGFAYISGHGIPQALIDRVFDASARFHALPREQKMAVELNDLHRGFIPINTSTDVNSSLADVKKPNQSESFMVMREAAADDPDVLSNSFLTGPNQWPDLDGFRGDVMEYNDALADLGQRLMGIAAMSVGADPRIFSEAFERPTTWLRLLYYPPTTPVSDTDLYGSAPHTDFGCLTILAQDDIGGLQVMTPDGDWVDAPPRKGSFVLNVGDMLHRWSNGRLRSTPHRVINHSGRARFSCPFFFDPNVNADVAPLESCVDHDHPSRFEPINFGDFLRSELGASYEKHKSNA